MQRRPEDTPENTLSVMWENDIHDGCGVGSFVDAPANLQIVSILLSMRIVPPDQQIGKECDSPFSFGRLS